MPDEIWTLTQAERDRNAVSLGIDFWTLAPGRYFVRSLLAVPVPGEDEFCFGVWVEVSEAIFRTVFEVWDNAEAYESLAFDGCLANKITAPGWNGSGAVVHLQVRNIRSRPYVVDSADCGLKKLLSKGWTRRTFEQFARTLMAAQ